MLGSKLAPEGRPATVRVTGSPSGSVAVTLKVREASGLTVSEPGRLISGGVFSCTGWVTMLTVMSIERVTVPLVHVTVTVYGPVGVDGGASTVRVELPELPGETWTLGGLRDDDSPVGETVASRLTVPP